MPTTECWKVGGQISEGGNEVDIQTEETYREHRGYILVAIDVSNCPFDVAKGNMWK